MIYGARRWSVPSVPEVQTALERKLWFDDLYDARLLPARRRASRSPLRRYVEEPLIGGSITGVSLGARRAGGAVGEAQTGYLRSYALAIAAAVAVLVVVFISVQ